MTKEAGPKRVEVTLKKPHTHAGKRRQAGDKIMVTEPQRDWLVAQAIINATPAASKDGAK